MFKFIVIILLTLSPTFVYAACDKIKCTGKVSFIYIDETVVRILMDQDMKKLNCSLGGGKYLTLRESHPLKDDLYKLLLASHLSHNPKVTVRISENTQGCKINYITSSH